MIGIEITQEIKSKNDLSNSIGSILTRSRYPRKFWVTERVIGGYDSRTDLHQIDGWMDIIRRVVDVDYDPSTQKLGDLIEVDGILTEEIINLTQEEIDALAETNAQNEADNKREAHIEKGEELFRETYRKIWRRKNKLPNSEPLSLGRPRARRLMTLLAPTYIWLRLGDFNSAKDEIDAMITNNQIELDNTLGMIRTAEGLQSDIADYLTGIEYDL